ncbi:MAG TPA: serine/threonine-protein kinase [Vicinamibacteria bacterium]|nr:serine/threonine-protein kinase [Vicinamibacteria bacterium]
MTPDHWGRLKEIFEAALQEPLPEREAFLDRVCTDPELRTEAGKLLAAHDQAGTFIEDSPVAGLAAAHAEPAHDAWLGRRVGPYRLLAEIGRGGMGTVYRAVRDDDQYRKEVAIKLVQDLGSGFVLDRFLNERQILAGLDHPHIARLLDGGTTSDGRPYLVMDLVEGEPIDVYGQRRALDVKARLELFREVCGAVQYAHQNLVVHRDIKPGNILVTRDGTPKLLDFGIAKLLRADGDVRSPPGTVTQFRALTLDYASPEQVRGQPITTASDVYSLGVLLYELLAGQRPHAAKTPEELVRAISEAEPPRPSTVVPELRGDLDNILMMALRKEPSRRYASVEQFSEDVRRYLASLPVIARQDTLRYRATKFVGRHRLGVVASALLTASLVGGMVATSRQARIARAERARAEKRFDDLRKLANDFLFEFHDAIANLPGSTPARELVVKRAAQYLDSLAAESTNDVGLKRELAAAFERLGDAQGGAGGANLGDPKGALASYTKALDIWGALAARPAPPVADGLKLAELELRLSTFFVGTGELARAEERAKTAVSRIEALRVPGAVPGETERQLASAYNRLGYAQGLGGDERGARESIERSVSICEAFCAAHPDDMGARASLASALNTLALGYWQTGQREPALSSCRKARLIQEALAAGDPNNARLRRDLVVTLRAEANYLSGSGHSEEALRTFARALSLVEANLAADPRNRWDQVAVMMVCRSFGQALSNAGRREAAILQYRRAVLVGEQVLQDDPTSGFSRNELAVTYECLGAILVGRAGAAEPREGCHFLALSRKLFEALEREGHLSQTFSDVRDEAVTLWAQCRHQ